MVAGRDPQAGLRAAENSMGRATTMRKLSHVSMALLVTFGFTLAIAGCGKELRTKTETKVTGPGGQITRQTTLTVGKAGKARLPIPSGTKKP